jgi:hypothetical protein
MKEISTKFPEICSEIANDDIIGATFNMFLSVKSLSTLIVF